MTGSNEWVGVAGRAELMAGAASECVRRVEMLAARKNGVH